FFVRDTLTNPALLLRCEVTPESSNNNGGMRHMKRTLKAIFAVVSVAALAGVHDAQAASMGRGIRADLPCPYGGAGGPNPDLWGPTTGSSPFNPGLVTANTATLVAGSTITT